MTKFLWLTDWHSLPKKVPVAVNPDSIVRMYEPGNVPPATRIEFKREEARDHLDVAESLSAIASQFGVQLTGYDEAA
jgi:hypothetical protein